MAAKYGVKAIYGPIIELAITHGQTKVFDTGWKYFNYHAMRLGYMINRFGLENFGTYIKCGQKLLRCGVYDWSVEQKPEEWEQLVPAIEKHGFGPVLNAFIWPMCALSDVRGTKDGKYHYSLFTPVFWGLAPYLLPRLLEQGPEVLRSDLQPIVDFVRDLHSRGAFAKRAHWGSKEGMFFKAWRDYLPFVLQQGVTATLAQVRTYWESELVP